MVSWKKRRKVLLNTGHGCSRRSDWKTDNIVNVLRHGGVMVCGSDCGFGELSSNNSIQYIVHYIHLYADILWKGRNPILLPASTSKVVVQTGFNSLGW